MTATTDTPAGTTTIGQFPASSVCDQIVEWTEVREGDLVVWDGEFHVITRMLDYNGQPLMWFDGSVVGPGTLPCGTYAAVRRYLTEEG
jgi:hypothetical protein